MRASVQPGTGPSGRGKWLALGLAAIGVSAGAAMVDESRSAPPAVHITVVYDNVPRVHGLTSAWGFAAVVESGSDVLLFDTGGDGPTLLGNLERLGIDPAPIDAVVLSHIHGDHTGGLDAFLARRSDVAVYVPRSFPPSFRRAVEQRGARIEAIGGPQRLFAEFYSTGEMGDGTTEQALIVDTAAGLVVITGCAHPGVVEMARAARAQLGKEISLLMGGFHLGGQGPEEIRSTIAALRRLGVRQVAPSHCTGEAAIELIRESWGSDFIEGGSGAVIDVP